MVHRRTPPRRLPPGPHFLLRCPLLCQRPLHRHGWSERQSDGSWVKQSFSGNAQFNADGYPSYLNSGKRLRTIPGQNPNYYNRPDHWPRRNGAYAGKVVLTWKGNADIRVTHASSQISGSTSGSILNSRRESLMN